jgi:hypothetical protein
MLVVTACGKDIYQWIKNNFIFNTR